MHRKAAMKKLAKERRRPYDAGMASGKNGAISTTGVRRSSTFSVTVASLKKKSKPRDLLMWYSISFFAIALSGGFAVLPALGLGEWIGVESKFHRALCGFRHSLTPIIAGPQAAYFGKSALPAARRNTAATSSC
jgi:hypothetical protein